MGFLDFLSPNPKIQNKDTTSSQTLAPWEPAQAGLMGILGGVNNLSGGYMPTATEQGAFNTLTGNAMQGDPFRAERTGLATSLFGGGGGNQSGLLGNAYSQFANSMQPYTTASTDPYSNQAFSKFTSGLTDDITDRIKSQYAGAGYSGVNTGDFGKQLGEGISRGVAPTWLQASNDLEGRKLGAINSLYGAGNNTAGLLTNMNQIDLGNRIQGLGVADAARGAQDYGPQQLLAIEAARRGIPINQLTALTKIGAPIGSLGRTATGTENTKMTEEGGDNPMAALIGMGITAAGIMTGNPMMAMGGMGAMGGGMGGGSGMNGMSPMGGNSGNFFPSNAAASGANAGFMKGYGFYPEFR